MEEKSGLTKNEENIRKNLVHYILSFSYLSYFLSILIGVLLDIIIPIRLFQNHFFEQLGFVLIVLGSLLAYWAQSTSYKVNKRKKENGKMEFHKGPYKFSRSPTHLGLLIMTMGFGFVIQSFFIIVLMILNFLFTKLVFLKKEESLLEKKYGEEYSEYKKKVKTWL